MARIQLQNVTKVFEGNVTAVSNLSLDVPDGLFMVIVGPSGCGKTTTLRMIAGLEKPTAGNIYIANALVNNVPPKDRDVAMVFQNYALYPHMTVYQNMAFALKVRRFPKAEINQKVAETAGLLGIEHLLDRKPSALSGGQRQRVALGRAIVRNPKAFLFDEPLSNLDAKLRAAMRAELKALHKRLRAASIYVTHDQAEAMTLGDRIAVMCDGVLQQSAAPMEVYEKPANRFVAGFIGSPPMNFFMGRLQFNDDAACFVMGDETITLPQCLKKVLADYRDREMVLGIRPESLSPNQFAGQHNNTISANVEMIEPLGAATHFHLTSRTGIQFVACFNPNIKLNVTDAVKINIDLQKVHIFEPGETGKNVVLSE
ncbi:MAG TPA: sn-glycerol-3-phosphate ABC transporter ATP-binding protein UgpC [Sedimentisphaerales bacterium]|nr:sn-glycerol-3-phosphate ABC transporter ATP-binding protein UgpC [Sedimentisphaerales bacterium]